VAQSATCFSMEKTWRRAEFWDENGRPHEM